MEAVDVLQEAALFAGQAPSIHNSQPWRWRLGDDVLDLFLATGRHLPATDPQAHLAVLSCGAALHHARVRIASAGRRAAVDRMPDRADPLHLARIRLRGREPVDPAAVRMAEAAVVRRTDRRSRPGPPLDTDKLRTVAAAVRQEGGGLRLIRAREVFDLAAAEDRARDAIAAPSWQAELSDWIGGERPFGLGVPAATLAPDPARAGAAALDLPGERLIADTHHRAAVFAILHGPGDERPDWLRGGEALSAGWLTAIGLDVSVLPLSAVIEVAESRRTVHRLTGGAGCPYLVLRFAATDPAAPAPAPAPRLPASSVIDGLRTGDRDRGPLV